MIQCLFFSFLIFLLNILSNKYIFLVLYAIFAGIYFIYLRKILYQIFSSFNQIQKNTIDFFIILTHSIYFSGYVLDINYLDDFISIKNKRLFFNKYFIDGFANQNILGAGVFQPSVFSVFLL